MTQNKMTAPVLAHRNGQKRAIVKKHNPIVPYLRSAVKMASVTLLVYMTTAAAALNIPAFLAGMLLLNALLGLYFRLEVLS
ncbi:MAG TPA: hypothetical protein H9811_06865 [Candidatus Gemmiger excrementigallinarum]|uniref:Uncharacterized protein n=1 Tax=Candidatus Gemmiger excrementigallinarum TaxID=2838609 RepID=A0A9D2ES96_9FIRM|nr:hypothetical protein [Candidatus Gemmiger excrementigallinarum]